MEVCSVKGCKNKVLSRGWCAKHYARWRKYGDPLELKQKQLHGFTVEQRFWVNVNKTGKCWEWTGAPDRNGYGRLNIDGVPVLAHRISWELHNGKITSAEHVLHKCDNPKCVRPRHLFLGDQAANNADMIAKKRFRPGVSKGEMHGCAKLTDAQALEIRKSAERGVDLAARYGVTTTTIYDIKNGKIWRHLPPNIEDTNPCL